jgi:hypothetical protein
MTDEFGPKQMDDLVQLVDGQIANAIANRGHPAMLEIYAHAKLAGDAEQTLLLATLHLIREYAKLAVLHFGSVDDALAFFNTRTTMSTLKRVEQEGDTE